MRTRTARDVTTVPDDLAADEPACAQAEATPWLLLAAGVSLGLMLTAGWAARFAWHAMHDLHGREVLGW